jgi:membrane-associated protease RseP (regulator of RpoE activity)
MLNMRGANLNIFDFDFDLTWAALFLGADEKIYGRYGSRDAESADRQLSLAGLRYAMQQALATHRRRKTDGLVESNLPPRTVEQYPAAKRLKENACIHCHQVYSFRRQELEARGQWQPEEVWVYPLPENVGLTIDLHQGNRAQAVRANSPADRAGLRAGDLLQSLNGWSVASVADVQYALHRAPAKGHIRAVWQRDGHEASAFLALPVGWRITDVAWRPSVRSLGPSPSVHGDDLTVEEKRALGLAEKSLAFRQGNFVSEAARQAGIRQNDIILGVDNRNLEMSARQFSAYVRLTYQVGDRVTFNLLRDGQRLDVSLKLPNPTPY